MNTETKTVCESIAVWIETMAEKSPAEPNQPVSTGDPDIPNTNDLYAKLRAADNMARIIDEMVINQILVDYNILDDRSELAEARLKYGKPWTYYTM